MLRMARTGVHLFVHESVILLGSENTFQLFGYSHHALQTFHTCVTFLAHLGVFKVHTIQGVPLQAVCHSYFAE